MMTRRKQQNEVYRRITYLGIFILLSMSLGVYGLGLLDVLDHYLQDSVYSEPRGVSTRIVLVGIDEKALNAFGQWPWPRTVLANLLEHVNEGKPKAIGLDILLGEPAEGTDVLANVIRSLRNVVLPVAGHFDKRSSKKTFTKEDDTEVYALQAKSMVLPQSALVEGATLAHINVFPDESDGVVRRVEPYVVYQNTLYPSFAQALWQVGTKESESPLDSFRNSPFIHYVGKSGSFGLISAADVVSKKVPSNYFKDCYVLIGPAAIGLLEDRYLTAIDRQFPMMGLEIHANVLQGIIEHNQSEPTFSAESNLIGDVIVLTFFIAMGVLLSRKLPTLKSALILALVAAGYVYCAYRLHRIGYRVTILYPLLCLMTSFFWCEAVQYAQTVFEKRRIRQLFTQYVAPEVVEEIIEKDSAMTILQSRRREVTVMFVDIRGFTSFSERIEPESVVQILNGYLTLTSSAIFNERGTVDKFIGDATMAVFNAPLEVNDHTLACLRAAMAIRNGADQLASEMKNLYNVDLQFGIGIHTGEAIIGNIGSSHRLDYTAIGDTVNTASRLESVAKAGEILVSSDVVHLADNKVQFTYLGEFAIKGKELPVAIYRAEKFFN